MTITWPEIFNNPDMDYCPELNVIDRKKRALADNLIGWANCMSGHKVPEKFGEALQALQKFNGVLTYEDAMKASAGIVSHIVQNGSHDHVLWWDSDGEHCSVKDCEVNLRHKEKENDR